MKVGLLVTAFQVVGPLHFCRRRYPAFSWIVRGWFEDQQVVMKSAEFRKTFGPRRAVDARAEAAVAV